MKKLSLFIIASLLFFSCKPSDTQTIAKNIEPTDFISTDTFGIINFNLKSIESTKGIKEFLHEKLGKNKEFKILNELKLSFAQFANITVCLNSNELYIITLKEACEFEQNFNNFLKDKSPKYNGERLLFENNNVYRLSRKDESRFCAQVSPKILIIGQQQELLSALSIKTTTPAPITKMVDFSLPLSLLIQQSDLLPPQLKDIKQLSGKASYTDSLGLNVEGQFLNLQALKSSENMIRTLLGFTSLPNEMRKSIKFEQDSMTLKISAQVKDEEVVKLLEEAKREDKK